jgi:hypothetical protein
MFIQSCKKYDDGPSFTLLTKKMRITGEWKFSSAYLNGSSITSAVRKDLGEGYVWSIKNNGTYSENANVNDAGIWKFIDDKEAVRFTSSDTLIDPYEYRIRRLTNKDLWFETTVQRNTFIIKFYQ